MAINASNEKKLILLLFFLSGISGLIYEVVWLRMLSRVLGVTNYATAVTLAAYMAGLGIGSYIWGRIGDKSKHLIKTYAWLQLSIAAAAVITPFLFNVSVPLYKGVYALSNDSRAVVNIFRIIISFFTLLIPTILMGGTLPVLAAYTTKQDKMFGSNLSLLYGFNTLGAVLGVLLSGFITIGTLGEWGTILIGVAINLIVAEGSLILSGNKKGAGGEEKNMPAARVKKDVPISPYSDNIRKLVLASIMISGFTSLAYEVIWTRQLILYLNVTIYAFSGMLAVFLAGVALGSLAINSFINKTKSPLLAFGVLEMILGFLSILNLYIFRRLEVMPLTRIISPLILVFPMSFVFGMIFPVASTCYAKSVNKTGSSVAAVYGFNTIGNVLGSAITGFILIAVIGSAGSLLLLAAINVLTGFVLLCMENGKPWPLKLKYAAILPVVLLMIPNIINKDVFFNVVRDEYGLWGKGSRIYYHKESTQGTLTSFVKNNWKFLDLNGVGQTKLCTETKLMAHLPMLIADDPKKFLIICFGMGTILKSASVYRDLQIETVELVPEIYKCFKYYHPDAEGLLQNKNLKMTAEDGRNFLLLSRDKYDVISVDPSPPISSAGTVNLYTKEFFQMCREHLTPGGVMCMWFPGGKDADRYMVLNTFMNVFPEMTAWSGPNNWGFYMIGKLKRIKIQVSRLSAFFKNKEIIADLSEYDKSCVKMGQLLGLYFLDPESMGPETKKYPVITDDHPYTEFPLFRGI
jgi:spermidine synthase